MITELIKIDDPAANDTALDRAAALIRAGELVAFPTETVYGLGGDATNADAARRIYAAKGRPSDNPLIIHIASPEEAETYAMTSPLYYKLAKQFMPGPLTVILPRRDTIPTSVTGGLDTVAVRCPAHPVARALIRAAGVPIAAPSANLSGRPSPTKAEHVWEDMNGRIPMILDGGEAEFGLESTIIALQDDTAVLLRPGAITFDALCCVCAKVTIASAVTAELKENERPLSPGMKYRHYAPRASLILLDGKEADIDRFLRREATLPSVGILCYDDELDALKGEAALFPLGGREDLQTQAHRLFAALREADEQPRLTTLYTRLPQTDGIGLALYNRCIRAAAHTIKKVN